MSAARTPTVRAAALRAELGDAGLVILDATVQVAFDEGVRRWVHGAGVFATDGHLPGARHADLLTDLSAPSPFEFGLPDAAQFTAAARALGVAADSRVVVYDTTGTSWATRLWWLFRHFGHEDVRLLEGGLRAWLAAGGVLEHGAPRPAAMREPAFTAVERAGDIVSTGEVRASLGDPDVLVVSALPAADFGGVRAPRPRLGRIPGSVNIPASSLLDAGTGELLSDDELRVALRPVLDAPGTTVLHCGSGVSATLPLLALERLGHTSAVLYEESMNAWAADPANPIALG